MECPNCELKQRQFYCENCLKQHLSSFRQQLSHVSADRDARVAAAQRSLITVVNPARLRRADIRSGEERVREIWEGLAKVRQANEKSLERIQSLRENLAARRRTLAVASSISSCQYSSPPSQSASPPSAQRSNSVHQRTPPQAPSTPVRSPTTSSRGSQPFPSTSPQSVRAVLSRGIITPSPSFSPPGAYPYNRPSPPAIKYINNPDAIFARQIEEATYRLTELSDAITRARSGLVQELVEVFSVVEVGGRPPVGGKAGTKGEWTIGGLVLPVPGDMRRYPPDHINAVVTNILHFLSLLAFYLGIKLPFYVLWSRSSMPPSSSSIYGHDTRPEGLLGVGTPWIGATRGSENGGWARWSTKHPLHVSAAPPSSSGQTSPSQSPSRPSRPSTTQRSVSSPASTTSGKAMTSMDESHIEEESSTSASGSSFTTALAMLLYNVCYLAHTQNVDIPLAQAGEALSNLWAVCCSPELGKRSHATNPLLLAPTQPTFPLDFAQLLQATAANPSRARARIIGTRARVRSETIVEEDDGWDLI
ncbi:UV radiation resistance protein and autophagy-related subunit 14-domain-containing protein [Irpex rosettiformis]|uniref:UV radiation resistance protein and autophagy-related subunit 14-domain-containing protein n=1 Tax=Irpex rosettiformis TaxID=378272 RepID=A0ACB8U427_9APHY|nr:UV radiation resistance protein and autophagy-related subunit 14-domain-containing protein [Irpex rosettiformis]